MSEKQTRSIHTAKSVTIIGALINTALIILKFIGGILGHSQALIADAVHSISDLFTDAVVLVGIRLGKRDPDETHLFGHARMETLASAVVGMALIGTAIFIGMNASLNIYHHKEYHPTVLALWGAAISIVSKEALYQYTIFIGRRIQSDLIIANAWHHRSDAFSSVAVLIGVAGARLKPSWHILDSYAALLVSFFIIKVGLDILRNTLREFLDTAPHPNILNAIERCIRGVEGVMDTHDIKVRTSGGLYQMETHIVVDGNLTVVEGHKIAKSVETCLMDEIPAIGHVIIHVDPKIDP
ncbi:MAG: cation transporter [Deltaproteobacteria bacterium]|nr:cation transporter [Deltaproteobacteria bacterium]